MILVVTTKANPFFTFIKKFLDEAKPYSALSLILIPLRNSIETKKVIESNPIAPVIPIKLIIMPEHM